MADRIDSVIPTHYPDAETHLPTGINQAIHIMWDGAFRYTSKVTKKWVKDNEFAFLVWPSRSPDRNPFEIVWRRDAKTVYVEAWQYKFPEELEQCVQAVGHGLLPTYFKLLLSSMPKSCVEVLLKRGAKTHYQLMSIGRAIKNQ